MPDQLIQTTKLCGSSRTHTNLYELLKTRNTTSNTNIHKLSRTSTSLYKPGGNKISIKQQINLCEPTRAYTNIRGLVRICTSLCDPLRTCKNLGEKMAIKHQFNLCKSTRYYADLHERVRTSTSIYEPLRAYTNMWGKFSIKRRCSLRFRLFFYI